MLLGNHMSLFIRYQGDVWICMELMDKSLDKLCHLVYKRLHEVIPEIIVGRMAESV